MEKFVSNNTDVTLVVAPASKSYAQRILLAAALCKDKIDIKGIGNSNDVRAIVAIVDQLGAEVEGNTELISVHGQQSELDYHLKCGESGLGLRLTVPIAASFGGDFEISGEGSLLKRPITQFLAFLPKMGIETRLTENGLPLFINGILKSGEYTVDGSLSSQYISGLIMALLNLNEDSILNVQNPTSLPYIDITLDVLKSFGIEIINDNYKKYTIKGAQNFCLNQNEITVEGDWSGAAFWIVYGMIKGGVTIENLNKKSVQADKEIIEVIKKVGGEINWTNEMTLEIKNTTEMASFDFDATQCPDLFPVLVVLAASIKGESTIHGVHRLKYKESDRGEVLVSEFRKLGLEIKISEDRMIIDGTGELNSGTINSFNDHRIAMAFSIAAMLTKNGLTIQEAECVNKSYPSFFEEFSK